MNSAYTEKHTINTITPTPRPAKIRDTKTVKIKDEIQNLNNIITAVSEQIALLNKENQLAYNDMQIKVNDMMYKLTIDITKQEIKITKYISENAWKTVGLLLGAQTGMLAIFGFVQNFILQK